MFTDYTSVNDYLSVVT